MSERSHCGLERNRSLLRRILWYRDRLKAHGGFTTAEAAEVHEVVERTIYRDIDYLRTLGWDLEYHRGRRRWELAGGGPALPLLTLREGEVVALLVAEEAVRCYAGTPYADALRNAFGKVMELLDHPVSLDLSAEPVRFTGPPVRPVDVRQFEQVERACRERRRLEIRYLTPETGEVKRRRIDPYHILSYAGDRYLVAYDHLRGDFRTFALGERMQEVRETGERFERDEGFDLERYRAEGFGLFRGGTVEEVVLRFAPSVSRYLREKVWDESESKEELPDGSLLLRMRVPINIGLRRFVLQYGAEVEVLAPERFRREMAREAVELMAIYAGGKGSAGADEG